MTLISPRLDSRICDQDLLSFHRLERRHLLHAKTEGKIVIGGISIAKIGLHNL